MTRSETTINESEVAGKIGGYFGVAGSDPRITPLLAMVLPEVKLASTSDPAGWQSAFLGVMAKYEGLAKELGLGIPSAQRDLDILKNANRTDATFAGAIGRLGPNGLRHYAMQGVGNTDDRDSGARTTVSSAAYGREAPLTMSGAVGFAKELGIHPANAVFFEGGSAEMRNAIRDAIKGDKPISDEKIKDMHDVGMVLGAIRSGKIKENDPKVPDSVRKVIKQMRDEGVDPVEGDAKVVKKYLDAHPKLLDAVRAKNAQTLDAVSAKSDAELKAENLAAKVDVVSPATKATKGTTPKIHSAKLGGS